ncbi:MAG TPA: TadE/TadG family type IV pilus assembly protein [Bryobacteraceae bacterium]|jgi:Flp pilus assembly protein TadG
MRRTGTSARSRRRSGHVLLEAALAFMPFCALIFGIADFSMVMFIDSTFQNAVRQGVRFGITYNLTYNGTTYASQTAAIRAVVEANSAGWLTSAATSGPAYIQVNYYTPDNLSTPATSASLPKTVNSVLISNLNQSGNVLEVKILNYPWNWMVPLPNYMPGQGLTLTATSVDVMQGLPVGTTTPPSP